MVFDQALARVCILYEVDADRALSGVKSTFGFRFEFWLGSTTLGTGLGQGLGRGLCQGRGYRV